MAGTNLIVFRDDSRRVPKNAVLNDLKEAIARIQVYNSQFTLAPLILAGQVEAALWDCAWPCAEECSQLTNALARCFIEASQENLNSLSGSPIPELPDFLLLSRPEGFAYYALHPADFADTVASFGKNNSFALIGIRSIGTTLSAVALAQLQANACAASRTTVRPLGHPYERTTQLSPRQIAWVERHRSHNSLFLILDEGPGLSGSSFLSAAESLVNQGVPAERIHLIGTRDCDPEQLCAPRAALRWKQFGWRKVESRIFTRFSDLTPLNGGLWRERFLSTESVWPSCWTEMETLRFLTPDQKHILKFEGLGQTGAELYARAEAIHKAGFGPNVENAGDGMNAYNFVAGQPLSVFDLSPEVLDHMARYCAFRANVFRSSGNQRTSLASMTQFNFLQETGDRLDFPPGVLEPGEPAIVDARMHPHEWIRSTNGKLFKVDAVRHGDDHFLPGPTDIAWDLAGAIVEWDMSSDAANYFEAQFAKLSGQRDDRLPYFILAYSVFRMAYCRMASQATQNRPEKQRLHRASQLYRKRAEATKRMIRR